MVIRRKISTDKYIIAGVLTLVLFFFGVALGILLDSQRLQWLEYTNKQQDLDFKSLQFQYLYLTSLGDENNSCPVLQATLRKTISDLSNSLDKFQSFKSDTQLNSEDYRLVGRRYLIDNLNYWLFARKSKQACGLDVLSILYFYTEKCDICPDQGVILTYFKNVFGDKLLVFPIDAELASEEPMVEILLSRFNVTTYPTIIVGDKKYPGVVSPAVLRELICRELTNESSC